MRKIITIFFLFLSCTSKSETINHIKVSTKSNNVNCEIIKYLILCSNKKEYCIYYKKDDGFALHTNDTLLKLNIENTNSDNKENLNDFIRGLVQVYSENDLQNIKNFLGKESFQIAGQKISQNRNEYIYLLSQIQDFWCDKDVFSVSFYIREGGKILRMTVSLINSKWVIFSTSYKDEIPPGEYLLEEFK